MPGVLFLPRRTVFILFFAGFIVDTGTLLNAKTLSVEYNVHIV